MLFLPPATAGFIPVGRSLTTKRRPRAQRPAGGERVVWEVRFSCQSSLHGGEPRGGGKLNHLADMLHK